jgi:hypothetical protein
LQGRDRKGLRLGDFRHVLRIVETVGRLGLRIVLKRLPSRSNQAGVLVFSPTFALQMYAWPVLRLTAADATAIALDDCQLRWLFGTLCQCLISIRGRVSPFGQLASNVMHDTFDRLGGNGDIGLAQGNNTPLERTSLRCEDGDLSYYLRRQFAGVKPQRFA